MFIHRFTQIPQILGIQEKEIEEKEIQKNGFEGSDQGSSLPQSLRPLLKPFI